MTDFRSTSINSDVHPTTWLRPDQVEAMRDACLTDAFPKYLHDRNEVIDGPS